MTIWERFTNRIRDAVDNSAGGPISPRDSTTVAVRSGLADRLGLLRISDDALGTELSRRRRARGKQPDRRAAADDELEAMMQSRRARMRDRPLAKSYAVLEVRQGATRSEIERAFRSLQRQYHPDRHIGDAEQHKSAVALAVSVADAYVALTERTQPSTTR